MAKKQTAKAKQSKRSPLYQQTAIALESILEKAEPGSFLPSEPALAKRLGVSRATLREAMRTFEERGLIVRRQGVGTYVTHPPQVIETGLECLESLETLADRLDLEVQIEELEVQKRPPHKDEIESLDLDPKQKLVDISRVMLTEGRPVAFLIDTVPEALLPPEVVDRQFQGSVLDMFLRWGDPPLGLSKTEITAVSATAEVARKLRIQRGDVLLCLEAYLYSLDGKAVDHSLSYFLPGVFRFHVLRRVGR